MTLGILWFILIAVLICGYYVLDGFDLGVGILFPFIARDEPERRAVIRCIGPVWDGNEVWLLTAGGALFAAFAPAYATVFSGFYLAIMLVLFGLILRAVAIEFRAYDEKWRGLWNVLFCIGSFLPALLFGVALGNCLQGVALNEAGDYIGSFWGLLTPFPLLCGLLGLSTIITQGASWLAAKIETGTDLHRRASNIRLIMQGVTILLVAAVTVVFFFTQHVVMREGLTGWLTFIFAATLAASLIFGFLSGNAGRDWPAFLAGSIACVALFGLLAAALFPLIVISTGPGDSISIANAASSDYALTVMTIIACIGIPLVLIYHVVVYRTFRGRISVGD